MHIPNIVFPGHYLLLVMTCILFDNHILQNHGIRIQLSTEYFNSILKLCNL